MRRCIPGKGLRYYHLLANSHATVGNIHGFEGKKFVKDATGASSCEISSEQDGAFGYLGVGHGVCSEAVFQSLDADVCHGLSGGASEVAVATGGYAHHRAFGDIEVAGSGVATGHRYSRCRGSRHGRSRSGSC